MKILLKITTLLCIVAIMCSVLCACDTKSSGSTVDLAKGKTTINESFAIDNNNIEESIDISKANKITLNNDKATADNNCAQTDGAFVTIEKAGVYLIDGSANNGQIKVKAQDTDVVVLVLNGVDITNQSGCPIHIKKAQKAYIVPYKGSQNKLSDTANYQFDADDTDGEPDATIFSKSDLLISGSGTLNITANYSSAIKSKDNLCITKANITATSVDDGIKGRDSLTIEDSTITLDTTNTAVKTTNDEENIGDMTLRDSKFTINSDNDAFNCKNNLYVNGGSFTINAGDDAFHADATLSVNNGNINIEKCYEGLEGQQIKIAGGNIHIISSDDGLNSAGGNDSSAFNGGRQDPFAVDMDATIDITGGYIYINSSGDGIDSNGTITMSGGTVLVDGPENSGNGALDYASTFTCDGGLLVASGMSGMAQAVSDSSSQYCIMANISTQNSKTLFSVLDKDNNALITYAPSKSYSNIIVCSDKLKSAQTYTISTGGKSSDKCTDGLYSGNSYSGGTTQATFTLNSIVTSNGGGMGGPGDMGGHGGMGGPGDMGGMAPHGNHRPPMG